MSQESQVGRAFLDVMEVLKGQLAANVIEHFSNPGSELSKEDLNKLVLKLQGVVDTTSSSGIDAVLRAL